VTLAFKKNPRSSIQTKRAPNCLYYLQRAVTPHPTGGVASFYSRVEKPSDDISSRLILMNKKGLMQRIQNLKGTARGFSKCQSMVFRICKNIAHRWLMDILPSTGLKEYVYYVL
jgi:hypothetical protein